MNVIWTPNGSYTRVEFDNEADLEETIIALTKDLFGPGRIYLDLKKKIGKSKQNIPDGYLLDLSSSVPRLYVVENEISGHHPTKHIAIQLVEFMSSFIEDRNGIRNILVNRLNSDRAVEQLCESYIASLGLHSIEDLIHKLVFEGEFAALVPLSTNSRNNLETILNKGFGFKVEVLRVRVAMKIKMENECIKFKPFLAGLQSEE